jgi:hypothetical protein
MARAQQLTVVAVKSSDIFWRCAHYFKVRLSKLIGEGPMIVILITVVAVITITVTISIRVKRR